MKNTLLIASAILNIVAVIPYIIDTFQGRTKPRVVTWFNWALLTGIATAAALADHQYPSAVLTGAATLGNVTITFLALKLGDRKFEIFDVICQLGAIIGVVLWIVFNSPLIAIIATVSIDFMAGLPTWKHAWQKPHEETVSLFIMGAISGILALAATHKPHLSGLIYPIFIVFTCSVITAAILCSPHRTQHNGVEVS